MSFEEQRNSDAVNFLDAIDFWSATTETLQLHFEYSSCR